MKQDHPDLSVRRQCSLLSLTRSTMYYQPRGESAENLAFMAIMDRQFLDMVAALRHRSESRWRRYGSRQMARHMQRAGHKCGRRHAESVPLARRVRRLMKLMRLMPIYQEPKTSRKNPAHTIYPHHPAQPGLVQRHHVHPHAAWISLSGGRHGLAQPQGAELAVVEQFGMRPPSVRGPCGTDAGFCVEALKEALGKYGPPEIFNSDQGSHSTSADFTDVPKDTKVRISMDGRGRWIDNRTIAQSHGCGAR